MNKIVHLLGESRVMFRLIVAIGFSVIGYKLLRLALVPSVWIMQNNEFIGTHILYPAAVLSLALGSGILVIVEIGIISSYIIREIQIDRHK